MFDTIKQKGVCMAFTLTINNEQKTFSQPVILKDLLSDHHQVLCAKVNHRIRDLSFVVYKDATIEFLTLIDQDAIRLYETSLRYLIAMALYQLYPNLQFRFSYFISRSIFIELVNENALPTNFVHTLEAKMKTLVAADLPLIRRSINHEEAKLIYEQFGQDDKLAILPYRPESTVHIYECGDYRNYMYGHMVASTRFLGHFALSDYQNGCLVQYPRAETNGQIPRFEDAPIYSQTLQEAHAWSKITKADSVAAINAYIKNDQLIDFIHLCEARHQRMLVELGQAIEAKQASIRLICIAGPSSSGKTTFANRLRIELLSRGLQPIRISIDDYYLPKEKAPKDASGQPDLENIHALDLKQFNNDLTDLIAGKKVTMPLSKFDKGHQEAKTLQIDDHTMVIIEGIHALNDALTSLIPKSQKYKIFISPQSQMSLDHHNPMSLTDMRLLRRIVRDKKYRNSSAEQTIDMWPSVRRGEFRWIYQTQEEANYVFNSYLPYEGCVMRKYAIPVLSTIEKDAAQFPVAERLLRMLKYFVEIEETWIPSNSLLREFIGGSCFREVDD
jgi:uridine kinase